MADAERITARITYDYLFESINLAVLSLYFSMLLDDIKMTLLLFLFFFLNDAYEIREITKGEFLYALDVDREHEMAINRGSREPRFSISYIYPYARFVREKAR